MTKIPVGETITAAYRFTFSKFFDLLGLVWLPAGVLIVLSYFDEKAMQSSQAATDGAEAARRFFLYIIPNDFVLLVFFAMLSAGIAQEALGIRARRTRVYFSLGKPVRQLIGAYFLAALVLMIGMVAVVIAVSILAFIIGIVVAFSGTGKNIGMAVTAIVTVCALAGAMIYPAMRLTFLLTPVAIAEQRIGLKRAWALGRGNFWRIFLVGLCVSAPMIVITGITMLMYLPHGYFAFPPAGAGPAARAAYHQMVMAQMAAIQARQREYWYLFVPFYIAFYTVFVGLLAGAQCFAYRALVGKEALF